MFPRRQIPKRGAAGLGFVDGAAIVIAENTSGGAGQLPRGAMGLKWATGMAAWAAWLQSFPIFNTIYY